MNVCTRTALVSLTAILSFTFVPVAHADEIGQTLDFDFPLSTGSQILVFDQFDDQGGARLLTDVTITSEAEMGADVVFRTDSPVLPGINIQVALEGQFAIVAPKCSIVMNVDSITDPFNVSPSGSVDLGWFSGFTVGSNTAPSPPNDLGAYLGTGTIDVSVIGHGDIFADSNVPFTLFVDQFSASGSATLTYTYTMIPAPASFALLGIGLLSRRPRRRTR